MKLVTDSIQFFEKQCLEESDYVEGQYFFDIMRLPRNKDEAKQMARDFKEEEQSRLANLEYEEDEEEEEMDH